MRKQTENNSNTYSPFPLRLFLWSALLGCFATPITATEIINLRTGVEGNRTRVVFDTSDTANYKVFALENPSRVVIDFKSTDPKTLSLPKRAKSVVKKVRHARRGTNDFRVVLDLDRPARFKQMQLDPAGSAGHRVVVDLFDDSSIPTSAPAVVSNRGPSPDVPTLSLQTIDFNTPVPVTSASPEMETGSPAAEPTSLIAATPSQIPPAQDAPTEVQAVPDTFSSKVARVSSAVDLALADFNPIGEHVRTPIERAIPNLQVSGFLRQSSDILLNKSGPVGFRDQDFRFLQMQHLMELEANYHIRTGLDIRGVAHAMYDGVYEWQHSNDLFADSINREYETYDTSERVLRELYLSYRRAAFDLKIGKQQIAWGKMDGQFIDMVNAVDRREGLQLETEDLEFRRLPTWMANSTFYFDQTTVQLLYIFDFEHDRGAIPGSPWASPLLPTSTNDVYYDPRRPSHWSFGDHEYGIRIDRVDGALSYGFIYMYAWDKNAVDTVIGTAVRDNNTVLEIRPEHHRVHHVGVTSDYSFVMQNVPIVGTLPTVLRFEALYTNGVEFADFSKRALALGGFDTNGRTTRDTLRAAFAAEFALPQRTTLIIQPSWYQTLNYKEGLGAGFGGGFADEWSFIPVVYMARPFAFSRDRLDVKLTLLPLINGPDTGWGGIKTKLKMGYKLSQFLTANFIYTGYHSGEDTDVYGQFDKWDNIGWELNYEF